MRSLRAVLLILLTLAAGEAAARAADGDLCADAIRQAEGAGALPSGLLTAVAVSESGRYDRARRAAAPWPWMVNNAGDGRYFASKAEAMAHVDALRRRGERNIDVGCMQINLMHHPDAFADLEQAFEPEDNVAYGADFLGRLHEETRSWARAVERYHTADADRGRAYREKVYGRWQEARIGRAPGLEQPWDSRAEEAATPRASRVAAAAGLRVYPERRKLRPLAGRGFVSLAGAPGRVAVLRPSTDRQLKPIVRLARPSRGGLVRLTPGRRAVASSLP